MSRKRVNVPEDKKQQYISDILAKRRTQSEVAFLCDVTPGTVSQWVKAAKEQIARDAAAAADYVLGEDTAPQHPELAPDDTMVSSSTPAEKPVPDEPVGVDDDAEKHVEAELSEVALARQLLSEPPLSLPPDAQPDGPETLGDELRFAQLRLNDALKEAYDRAHDVLALAKRIVEAIGNLE